MRLSEMGISQREISFSVNHGKITVCDTQRLCREAGLTYTNPADIAGMQSKLFCTPRGKLPRKSVHYTLFKQEVAIRATSTMIEVINSNRECVALHPQRYSGKRYVTISEYIPELHKRYAEFSHRTGKDYLAWAETIGANTLNLIEKMLTAQVFEGTAYRYCMGVKQFASKYSPEKLEVACG